MRRTGILVESGAIIYNEDYKKDHLTSPMDYWQEQCVWCENAIEERMAEYEDCTITGMTSSSSSVILAGGIPTPIYTLSVAIEYDDGE